MLKVSTKKIIGGCAALLMAAAFMGCKTDPDPNKPDNNLPPVEDKITSVSENLIYAGSGEELDDEEGTLNISGDGSTITSVDDDTSGKCYLVTQTRDEWSEVLIDMSKVYGRGKSYEVSLKVKKNPADTTGVTPIFYMSYTTYSGAIEEWALENNKADYDWDDDDPNIISCWGCEWSDGEAFEKEDDVTPGQSVSLTDSWQEVYGIIPATAIDYVVNGSGLAKLQLTFYVGSKGEAGYSFLMDDLSVKDLNSEIKVTGPTWTDPNAAPEDEEPEEDE